MIDAAVVICNAEGKVVQMNNVAFKVFDLTSDSAIGHAIEQVAIPEAYQLLIENALQDESKVENSHIVFQDTTGPVETIVDIDFTRDKSGKIQYVMMTIEEACAVDKRTVLKKLKSAHV